jgi:integrase/recombinase XerD
MYSLGLRLKDAISLSVDSIDSSQMLVRIISKRNKERIIPLPEQLLLALREFWKTHRHPTWIFPGLYGRNHICRKSLYRAFNGARDSIGLGSEVKLHSLRHSYATHLLESGVDIRSVQLFLGHANIRSTQIYTHMTEARRHEIRGEVDTLFSSFFAGGETNE